MKTRGHHGRCAELGLGNDSNGIQSQRHIGALMHNDVGKGLQRRRIAHERLEFGQSSAGL